MDRSVRYLLESIAESQSWKRKISSSFVSVSRSTVSGEMHLQEVQQ